MYGQIHPDMKYSIQCIIFLMMFFSSCGNNGSEQQALIEASREELTTALSERDELLKLVKEISTATDQIKRLENIMTLTGTQSKEKNEPQHTRILTDISAIKQTLQRRREELAELEKRLRKSSLFNDDLQSAIEALRSQIDFQTKEIDNLRAQLSIANARIGNLSNTVDSLNTTMLEVSNELDASKDTSYRLENELNTCYYVIATKNQLKGHKIIESGFLRRTKLMNGDFDKNFFQTGDKRDIKTLNLNSKKVKIYTNHPDESYEIIERGNKKILKIKNVDEFWSLTNYLVIQID